MTAILEDTYTVNRKIETFFFFSVVVIREPSRNFIYLYSSLLASLGVI